MLNDAIYFALRAHEVQVRKGTNIPYIVHPIRVMERLLRAGYSEEVACAGVLHDVITYCNVDSAPIEDQFGDDINELVGASTEMEIELEINPSTWKKRKEEKIEFFEYLKEAEQIAVIVADALDNLDEMIKDKKLLGDKLWDRFEASYEDIAWYYSTLRNIYSHKHKKGERCSDSFLTEFMESTETLFPMSEPIKFYYIHGFGSQFDLGSDKVTTLARLGSVEGKTWDYTKHHFWLKDKMSKEVLKGDYDIIVGSSLGGYWASQIGCALGIPFVAINPAIEPQETLKKYVGKGTTHYGKPYELKLEALNEYGTLGIGGCGLILLDSGDEVLDSEKTLKLYSAEFKQGEGQTYGVEMFSGGDHRFQHMEESLDLIEKFKHNAELVYGLDNDD